MVSLKTGRRRGDGGLATVIAMASMVIIESEKHSRPKEQPMATELGRFT